MNANEQVTEFNKEFRELITKHMNAGIPLAPVISTIDDCKFELQLALYQVRQEAHARELTQKILPANGIKLPPNFGHRR